MLRVLRRAATAVLLAFVTASVVTLVVQEVRGEREGAGLFTGGPSDGVLAVYFHRTVRCASCRRIEGTAREVVERDFKAAVDGGRLAWRTVDLDAPGFGRFAREYRLAAAAVVLIELRQGRPGRWKNLDRAWDFVDDPAALSGFFRREIDAFLKGS